MSQVQFHQVAALPAILANDAFYFIQNGNFAEAYLTNDLGEAKAIGNSTMVNNLIDQKLATYSGGIVEDTATITQRDLLNLDRNGLVLVHDASGDLNVTSGSAMYYYDKSDDAWTLVAEYESQNISLSWSVITDGPSSSPAAIDAAVTSAHSHTNKAVLDQLTDNAGSLEFNGAPIYTPQQWATNAW